MNLSTDVNLTNELARQRNRNAAERTLMAWIRTCLSLISFGFGLDKIIAAIGRDPAGRLGRLGVTPISLAFVLTGIVAMTAATVQHRRELRRLARDDYTYQEQPRLAAATATVVSLIGVMALVFLLLGSGA